MSVLAMPEGMTIRQLRDRFPGALEHIEGLDPDDNMHEGYLSLHNGILVMEPESPCSPLYWHQGTGDWYWEEEYPEKEAL